MKSVELYIIKADETYLEAQFMLQNEYYPGAVSRAYYAAFYAVQAVLVSKNISVKTHQGALMMFSKHFIKTGIFSKDLAKFLKENLDKRLLGDYEIGFKADQADAELTVMYADNILKSIKEYINKNQK